VRAGHVAEGAGLDFLLRTIRRLFLILGLFFILRFLIILGLLIVRARLFGVRAGTAAAVGAAALHDQRRERIGKRKRLAVNVRKERIGEGQLRVARSLDTEGEHNKAAVGLDGLGARRRDNRADTVARGMRIVCREHVADQFTVFNAGAFNNGIVIAQLDLHSTQACVAGQVNRNGKGLPNLRKLVRGRELQRRTCGAGKRHQQLHGQQQCDTNGQYSVAFHSSHSSLVSVWLSVRSKTVTKCHSSLHYP
jgi:hypothetical protein